MANVRRLVVLVAGAAWLLALFASKAAAYGTDCPNFGCKQQPLRAAPAVLGMTNLVGRAATPRPTGLVALE